MQGCYGVRTAEEKSLMRLDSEKVLMVPVESLCKRSDINAYIERTYKFSIQKEPEKYKKIVSGFRNVGVLDGDWDLISRDFRAVDGYYKGLKVYVEGGDFRKTLHHERNIIRYGKVFAEKDLERCIKMYRSIKESGYKVQPYHNKWDEYITVEIGRNGEIFLHNGRHRLAACLLSGIKEIPVKVAIRHKEWAGFKEKIQRYADGHKGKIYAPIDHPDLQEWDTNWDKNGKRTGLITETISKRSNSVLDIGAHFGRYSFILAKTGRKCYAVELSKYVYPFLEKLNKVHGNIIETYRTDINSFIDLKAGHYDCVLALNIFHHFLKDKKGWEYFMKMTKTLDCNEMIFQAASDNELRHAKFATGKTNADILEALKKNTGLIKVRRIGEDRGRVIYHLTKGVS